jgi:hypothetical protein
MSELGAPQPRSIENPDEAHTLFFLGDTDYWRQYREQIYGESNRALTLVPVVKDGQRHDVAWLERTWRDADSGETHTAHHAACRCLADAEFTTEDSIRAMLECEAWQLGVINRAAEIHRRNQNDLSELVPSATPLKEETLFGVSFEGIDPLEAALLYHLGVVRSRPQYWEGNIKGGEHQLHLLSVITGFDPVKLAERASSLSEGGVVEFDGDQTVKLAA